MKGCSGELKAVWRRWEYLEGVGVVVMRLLWGIEGRWELFLSKGLGGSGGVYRRSHGTLKGLKMGSEDSLRWWGRKRSRVKRGTRGRNWSILGSLRLGQST